MLSPDRCHTSVHMALELQTTPDPLVFVLVLNIQAPGAVKHQCSALMEKEGWKGHSSESEERRSQAGSLVEDLLELCKGISEKMHLGLFNPNESCLAYKFHLCQCCWCFLGSLVGLLVDHPTLWPCALGEPSSSSNSQMSLSWQVLCLAPWHRDAVCVLNA